MNAKPEHFLDKISQLDTTTRQYFPNSRKVYVTGTREDIRVPMREIALSDTETEKGREPNAPVRVYDTSGAYTDSEVAINLREGFQRCVHHGSKHGEIPNNWKRSVPPMARPGQRMQAPPTCALSTVVRLARRSQGKMFRSYTMRDRAS